MTQQETRKPTYRIKRSYPERAVGTYGSEFFDIRLGDELVGYIKGDKHAIVLAALFTQLQGDACVHPPECVVVINEEAVSGTVCYLCGRQLDEYPVDGDVA